MLLIPNAGNSTTVLEIIKQNIPEDIVVKNLHKDIAIIAIQGPKSVELVKDLGLPTDMEYMSFKDVSFMGNSVTICRTGYTGEKGFEVLVPAANAMNFWDEVFKGEYCLKCMISFGLGSDVTGLGFLAPKFLK